MSQQSDTVVTEQHNNDSTHTQEDTNNDDVNNRTARVFRVDLRNYYGFWDRPTLPELHQAIDTTFPMECPIIQEGRQNYRCSYTIHLNRPVPIEPVPTITIRKPIYSEFTEPYITVPLMPLVDYGKGNTRGGSNRVDGTLLTLVDAATRGREIPNAEFDKLFSAIGTVTKECELQRDKDFRRFNGNRYLIVQFNEGQNIPDTITIQDPVSKRSFQFYVRYAGKQWTCGRCDLVHSGSCPKSAALKACDDYRRNNAKTAIIIGDSTIRHLEERAFKADVAAMPGGTLGQLVAAATTHPAVNDRQDTYVVGGTNDVRITPEEENLSPDDRSLNYTHSVDTLVDKITTIVTQPQATPLTIILTQPATLRPEEQARLAYLREPLLKLAADQEKFTITELGDSIERTNDGHPTLKGTGEIVDKSLNADHVINKDVALYARTYNGLQRMWKGGCKSCGKVGLYYDTFDKCKPCCEQVMSHKPRFDWKAAWEKFLGPVLQTANEEERSNKKARLEPANVTQPTPSDINSTSVITPTPTSNDGTTNAPMES